MKKENKIDNKPGKIILLHLDVGNVYKPSFGAKNKQDSKSKMTSKPNFMMNKKN